MSGTSSDMQVWAGEAGGGGEGTVDGKAPVHLSDDPKPSHASSSSSSTCMSQPTRGTIMHC